MECRVLFFRYSKGEENAVKSPRKITDICISTVLFFVLKLSSCFKCTFFLVNKDGSHINKSDIPLLSAFLDLIKPFHGKTGLI